MPTVAVDGDEAGGKVTATATRCFIEVDGGVLAVVLVGDAVAGHGDHGSATMGRRDGAPEPPRFVVEGKAVCVTGDKASCGHTIAGSGAKVTVP
jgi:hypothetical protein